jgi:hypothetical protein
MEERFLNTALDGKQKISKNKFINHTIKLRHSVLNSIVVLTALNHCFTCAYCVHCRQCDLTHEKQNVLHQFLLCYTLHYTSVHFMYSQVWTQTS